MQQRKNLEVNNDISSFNVWLSYLNKSFSVLSNNKIDLSTYENNAVEVQLNLNQLYIRPHLLYVQKVVLRKLKGDSPRDFTSQTLKSDNLETLQQEEETDRRKNALIRLLAFWKINCSFADFESGRLAIQQVLHNIAKLVLDNKGELLHLNVRSSEPSEQCQAALDKIMLGIDLLISLYLNVILLI